MDCILLDFSHTPLHSGVGGGGSRGRAAIQKHYTGKGGPLSLRAGPLRFQLFV
jgi:hypothetical protein